MNCPNCNTVLPDTASMCYVCKTVIKETSDEKTCPNCGAPLPKTASMCYICKYQFAGQNNSFIGYDAPAYQQSGAVPTYNHSGMSCMRCGGHNIQIVYNRYQVATKGKSQVKKKSLARRKAEKEGRHMANLMTLGMYSVFSKKPSNYVEVSKDKFKNKTEKVAVCQDCGNSWNV